MLKKLLSALMLVVLPALLLADVLLFDNQLEPADPQLAKELKEFQFDSENLDHKIEELRKIAYKTGADSASKQNLAAFLMRKLVLNRDRSFDTNEDMVIEAADLVPGHPVIETFWGDMLYHSGDFEKSLSHFENALYKTPENLKLVAKCGLAALQLMHYEKALGYFNKALEKEPESFFLLFSAGRCNYELKYFEEAIELWEKAAKIAKNEREQMAVENAIKAAKEMLASTDGATKEENQRFVIHFAGNSQDDLGEVAFDTLDEVFFQVTDSLSFNPDVKINVVFFLTEEYYKINKEWSAGAAQGIQIMVPLKSGYKNTEYVKGLLAHEFTHTIIHLKTSNRCPLWLNEGLAQYQEFQASNGSPEEMRLDYQSIFQNEFVEKQNFVRLRDVPSHIGGGSRLDISKGYIASYLAVRCMADFYGESSFDAVLTALGQGKSIDEAMVEATGKNMEDFEDEFENWLKNL
ncbi:MAG: peptidase MA family metallohydrolase [Candidatus Rifleibacteriota bacterium]